MQPEIVIGNAQREGNLRKGWFVGHFMPSESGPCSTSEVEVKWGVHAAGEGRSEWGVNPQATTLSILISGRFRLQFPQQEVVLAEPGDYALWLPGVGHTWLAEADSTIVSIRYPSVPS
ncbi:signal peptidase I [Pseudanabaena sp. FACHB-2040]|uniref:signal peptidase I n=1 Tax=Pseudanabaena sp. FACHB-2040 TaxID=2692859 RepID=UPI001682F9A2|nr:signal peptidase I [Pseudanabaena sp. FACHB-2040]MBD2257698.1 signal peptidase I [Pseudanabaena sp. FACHB-2040]